MDFTLRIWRQKNAKSEGHFETYQVRTVLFLRCLISSMNS